MAQLTTAALIRQPQGGWVVPSRQPAELLGVPTTPADDPAKPVNSRRPLPRCYMAGAECQPARFTAMGSSGSAGGRFVDHVVHPPFGRAPGYGVFLPRPVAASLK